MIQVQELTKYYGPNCAVDHLNFAIPQGQVVGLLGLNGAGKSTTMNLMTGCLSPSVGTVKVDGMDVAKHPSETKAKIGYLPEIPPLYPDLRVKEQLRFAAELKGIRFSQKELDSLCGRVGVDGVSQRLIRNLSKGYRQRVGLAQALIGKPKALILDEPSVGLDPTQVLEMRNLIREAAHDTTIVFSSHILWEVQEVCDRIIVLHGGRIVADNSAHALLEQNCYAILAEGEPNQVLQALEQVPNLDKAELANREEAAHWYRLYPTPGADVRRDVFEVLCQHRLPLLDIRRDRSTLEEVFLGLVGQQPTTGGEDL